MQFRKTVFGGAEMRSGGRLF